MAKFVWARVTWQIFGHYDCETGVPCDEDLLWQPSDSEEEVTRLAKEANEALAAGDDAVADFCEKNPDFRWPAYEDYEYCLSFRVSKELREATKEELTEAGLA